MDEPTRLVARPAAHASYAKQADDDELEKHAMRVRARAIRRCGELLQAIDSKAGRPAKENYRDAPINKSEAARHAGMSQDQKNTALRVASIPEEEFTEAVESHTPPTITALAEQGTVKKYLSPAEIIGDRDPDDFKAATQAVGALRRFVELTQQHDPAAIVRGCDARERAIRRCGELLQAMENSKGGRPPKATYRDAPIGKSEAARHAGMSQDQKNTALRVASIPDERNVTLVDS